MKRVLSKILGLAAVAFIAASFTGCPSPTDNNPSGETETDIWEGAELIEDLAGKEVSWTPLPISSEISSRLQKDSKIIVQLDYNTIADDYIQFHVEDGNWGAVGVKDYYNAKGVQLDVEEESDEDGTKNGRFKIDVKPGVYYTVVTEDVLATLQKNLGFGGNFKLVKVGITNLKVEEKITEFAANGIGNVITFNVNADSTGTANKITLKYLRSAPSAAEKITLKNAVYYVQHNDGKITKVEGDIAFALNKYGNCFTDDGKLLAEEGESVTDEMRTSSGKYKTGSTELSDPETDAAEYQCELSYAEELKSGDTVKFQLVSATVTGEAVEKKDTILPKIKAVLIDADPGVDYYKELTAHLEDTVYPLVIKSGATVEAGEEESETPAVEVKPYTATDLEVTTTNNSYSTSTHGIQAKMTIRVDDALKGVSKDDTFVVVMKGTSTKAFVPQVYFMDNTEAGGYSNLGEWGDTVSFTTDEFEISKEITLSSKAPSSDDADAFVFVIDYDESGAEEDLENVTLNFTEFSVTKKVSAN